MTVEVYCCQQTTQKLNHIYPLVFVSHAMNYWCLSVSLLSGSGSEQSADVIEDILNGAKNTTVGYATFNRSQGNIIFGHESFIFIIKL